MECPVCKSKRLSLVYKRPFVETRTKQSIAECENCRLGISLPRLSQRALNSLYDAEYPPVIAKIRPSKLSDESLIQKLYRKFVESVIASYLALPPASIWRKIFTMDFMSLFPVKCLSPELSREDEILDFGAGSWWMVKLLRKHGYKAYGYDVFDECRQQDWFHDIKNSDKKFDEIRAFHVLEHMQEPLETLKFLKSKLKPGGRLVIGVPNFTSPLHRIGPNGGHFHLPYHRVHFSEESLEIACKKIGFELDSIISRSTETGYVSCLLNNRVSANNPAEKFWLKFGSTVLDAMRKGDAYELYARNII
ncbi:MAG: class I SAM-dependent methyltransferase [Candidatus Melainabacteria bacterium]|nr:class I SAM-dependent methyltransferase [Candidatus Melainabacteria bacterium]